ncbi:Ribosomal protein S2 domain containing protein [Aphelenchoides besseyi]|nr:Ribosomal protein S2 domain containing protein [Aphelenchoides besseyi]
MRLITRLAKLGKRNVAFEQRRLLSDSLPNADLLHSSTIRPEVLQDDVDNDLQSVLRRFNPDRLLQMDEMFQAGLWHGHKIGTLNENMKWALYGERFGTCIIDLDVTKTYMSRALKFLTGTAFKGGMILFVSTNRQTMHLVERKAAEIGEFAHTRYWEPGTLTNIKQLFNAPLRLPDVIIFLTTLSTALEKHPGIVEAAKMAIPTIGICDTNSEPNYLTYPVPGDDDSIRAVEFYMNVFTKAILFGKKARENSTDKSSV